MKRKSFNISSLLIVLFCFLASCVKNESATIPVITTTTASNISTTSATSGGSILDNGGSAIVANGICWSIYQNPSISESRTTDGVGIAQFTSNATGLTAGTLYHVRAYATNSVGTSYGADITFTTLGQTPVCLTQAATNINATGATLNGTINPNYLSSNVSFEYGQSVSYGNSVTAIQSPVTGNTITNVNISVTGLTPGTTYNYRIKTENKLGTAYGENMTFTTAGMLPSVVTKEAENIAGTSASLKGIVNANYSSTTVTFEYGNTATYGSSMNAVPESITGNSNTGVSCNLAGLALGAIYHFRVRAVNLYGTVYGNDMTFTTFNLPNIVTTDITEKTYSSAKGGGTVINDGGSEVIMKGLCWNTAGNPTTSDNKTEEGPGTNTFTSEITGLLPNTTYYVRAYATNIIGTAYGDQISLITDATPPTDGLVAFFPFNGNANDESGNNHNGSVSGPVLKSDRFGSANMAYYFDGVNDYIAIAPSSLVDNELAVTLSFWLKREATDGSGIPIHTGNQGRIQVLLNRDTAIVGVTTNSNYDGSAPSEFSVWTTYKQTDWNHVVLRYDGYANTLQIYLNGELRKSVFAEGNIWASQSSYLAFGVYYLFGSPHHGYYKGMLDDIRLYNRALNSNELLALYHEGGW